MKSSKEHLLADKAVASWWSEVARHPNFDRLILICGADIMAMREPDKIDGATRILEALRTMADSPEQEQPFPSPGLQHSFKPEPKI